MGKTSQEILLPWKPLGGNLCAALHEVGDDLGFLWQTGRLGTQLRMDWHTVRNCPFPFCVPSPTVPLIVPETRWPCFTEQRALTTLGEPLSTQNTTSPCQFLLRMHFPDGFILQCHLLWPYAHQVHMCGQSECWILITNHLSIVPSQHIHCLQTVTLYTAD